MQFRHSERIPVRFRDMDALGHVNNAAYITYLEIARLGYYQRVTGLTRPETGIIVARVECDYRTPAFFGETILVGCATTSIGTSSMTTQYRLTDEATGRLVAEASSVQVTYDYDAQRPIPVPPALRQAISEFEGIPL